MRKILTVQAIREKYPHPIPGNTLNTEGYCVGGAFCLAMAEIIPHPEEEYHFPTAWQLAHCLAAYDSNDDEEAWAKRGKTYLAVAEAITALNDGELFEEAWHLLGRFLLQNNRGNRDEQRL